MICSGGASAEAEELENAADKRVGAVADTIIDDMGRRGLQRQVMAIWNHYRSAVARYRGDPHQMLIDGCVTFLIEAKRRGIAQ